MSFSISVGQCPDGIHEIITDAHRRHVQSEENIADLSSRWASSVSPLRIMLASTKLRQNYVPPLQYSAFLTPPGGMGIKKTIRNNAIILRPCLPKSLWATTWSIRSLSYTRIMLFPGTMEYWIWVTSQCKKQTGRDSGSFGWCRMRCSAESGRQESRINDTHPRSYSQRLLMTFRCQLSHISYPAGYKHRMIMPKFHSIAYLITTRCLSKKGHMGSSHKMAVTSEQYWIVNFNSDVGRLTRYSKWRRMTASAD